MTVKKKFGVALIIVGIVLPIVFTIMFFADPGEAPLGAMIGLGIKCLISGGIGIGYGAKLVNEARKEEGNRITQEINQLMVEKQAEWLEETKGDMSLIDWLAKRGYLDKYKGKIRICGEYKKG